jgi:hypothetical protein
LRDLQEIAVVEAQADLVATLNRLVRSALKAERVTKKILLPTGDGMCIVIESSSEIDAHVRLALKILHLLSDYNKEQHDSSRRFNLRIGINENDDNLVTDINGSRNVAGAGINIAQRVMSAADGNQILLGQPVFEILRHRERYMNALRSYVAKVKHGTELDVHQLVVDSPGLNTACPSQFAANAPERRFLTRLVGYYIGHAIAQRKFLVSLVGKPATSYASKILLWFLAEDSVDEERSTDAHPLEPKVWHAGTATFKEQYEYYNSTDFHVRYDLAACISGHLRPYADCFDYSADVLYQLHFISSTGKERLKAELPGIWSKLQLDKVE